MPFLTLVAVLRLIVPIARVARWCEWATELIYRSAVRIDTCWLIRVLGMEMHVEGETGRVSSGVVLSNHRSWFDILLLQWLITRNGPIIKFVVKKELVWVPVIGWICLAMGFPRLNRSGKLADRERDYEKIKRASQELGGRSGMLLVFAEGTRVTNAKRDAQQSPFRHLLRPRLGGLRIMKENLPADTALVDITIAYPREAQNLWHCLSGAARRFTIKVERFSLSEIEDPGTWLERRWEEKDRWLDALHYAG